MKRNYNQIIRFADIHSKTDTIHRGTEGDEAIVRNRPTVSRCDASEPRFDNLFNRVYVLRHVHALFTVRFTFPDSASDDFARESRTPRRTVVSGIRDTRSIEKRTRPIGIDIDIDIDNDIVVVIVDLARTRGKKRVESLETEGRT